AGALHIVLAAQRVHADAGTADIAGGHGEVGDRHHRGRALAVLGHAEAIIDRAIAALRVKPSGSADLIGRNTGVFFRRFWAVFRLQHEGGPVLEGFPIAAFAHESFVDETFFHDDVG